MILEKIEVNEYNEKWLTKAWDYSREMGVTVYDLALLSVGKQLSKNFWISTEGRCEVSEEQLEEDWIFQDSMIYPVEDECISFIDDEEINVKCIYVTKNLRIVIKCEDNKYFMLEGV